MQRIIVGSRKNLKQELEKLSKQGWKLLGLSKHYVSEKNHIALLLEK